jgi:filamentous hemagglutinin family protein
MVSYLVMGGALAELSLGIACSGDAALAQITPDATLGSERSVVIPNVVIGDLPSDRINGGARRGANLFHSFQQFNIDAGRGVYFNNLPRIENILIRVTGSNHSTILGKLGVLGNANLFLINPNGIIFGPNASLDVRGSFVASTASSVVFADGADFSAKAPQTTPLLTVSVPIGLQFGENPGSIQGQGFELRLRPGKTLALVGGNVQLNRTKLATVGGRVELAGVGGPGTVKLSGNGTELQLSFPDSVPRADVSLTNRAEVRVVADGGGSIAINARNLNMAGASRLQAGIAEDLGSLGSQAGNIEVNATEKITLTGGSSIDNSVQFGATGRAGNVLITADAIAFDGERSDFRSTGAYSRVQEGASGQAGNIEIRARSLELTNGAVIKTSTRARGNAGNVTIIADTVSFDGQGNFNPELGFRQSSGVFSAVAGSGRGQGSSVNITAMSLSLTNSGVIVTSTLGKGDAGNIFINADTVSFDGEGTQSDFKFSGAYSNVLPGATGNGGDVTVTTGTLSLTNGAGLFASTDSQGDAGSVTINARDRVFFDGGSSDSNSFSGIFSSVGLEAVGNGGSIKITTAGSLSLTNGAELTSSSFGEGIAGDIQLTAGSIELNQGAISSKTGSGDGGNISLSVQDILLLRHGSQISTTAGTAQAGGNGGNINIDAPSGFIVAVKSENSDITANAFTGSGGRVQINAFGIFGMAVRSREDLVRLLGTLDPTQLDPRLLPTSDITAISQTNPSLSGQVTTITPDVDPSRGLVNLPAVPVDTEVAQGCTAGGAQAQSSFIITGRGGLPPNPKEALSSDDVVVNWVPLNPEAEKPSTSTVSKNPTTTTPAPLVEAQGWVMNNKGQVVLTASASTVTPHSSWLPPNSCTAPQSEARTGA